jgi:CheY-like chemotaxis protein
MSLRNIKMLHVEDDVSQRLLIAKHLASLPGYNFVITRAATEITAVAEFGKNNFDFVLLDYHLAQGNGLSCLRKLRQISGSVPIVAISGVASTDIIDQLKEAGADEFINKQNMQKDTLLQVVQRVLSRTNLRADLALLCRSFVEVIPPEFFTGLDEVEKAGRLANLTAPQVQQIVDSIAQELDVNRSPEGPRARRMLRPILTDLFAALYGMPSGGGSPPATEPGQEPG